MVSLEYYYLKYIILCLQDISQIIRTVTDHSFGRTPLSGGCHLDVERQGKPLIEYVVIMYIRNNYEVRMI